MKVYFPIEFVECSCKICKAIIELKEELDKSPIIVGNANTSLPTIDRTTDKKIKKNMEEWRGFHMYKELIYISEIIFRPLETVFNLLAIS